MNILKISRLNMLWFCLLAIACAEDKGNYTYEDKAVITIDSISSMSLYVSSYLIGNTIFE